MAQFHRAAGIHEITPGSGTKVVLNGKNIALFNINGTFHAIDETCPHRQGPLSEGALNGDTVSCPWHGWTFDLATGGCAMNPVARVGVYKTKVEQDAVFVQV